MDPSPIILPFSTDEMNAQLSYLLLAWEVQEAIIQIALLKALGPNGMSFSIKLFGIY